MSVVKGLSLALAFAGLLDFEAVLIVGAECPKHDLSEAKDIGIFTPLRPQRMRARNSKRGK